MMANLSFKIYIVFFWVLKSQKFVSVMLFVENHTCTNIGLTLAILPKSDQKFPEGQKIHFYLMWKTNPKTLLFFCNVTDLLKKSFGRYQAQKPSNQEIMEIIILLARKIGFQHEFIRKKIFSMWFKKKSKWMKSVLLFVINNKKNYTVKPVNNG